MLRGAGAVATIEERVPLEDAGSLSTIRGAFISASHYYDPDADPEGGREGGRRGLFLVRLLWAL